MKIDFKNLLKDKFSDTTGYVVDKKQHHLILCSIRNGDYTYKTFLYDNRTPTGFYVFRNNVPPILEPRQGFNLQMQPLSGLVDVFGLFSINIELHSEFSFYNSRYSTYH